MRGREAAEQPLVLLTNAVHKYVHCQKSHACIKSNKYCPQMLSTNTFTAVNSTNIVTKFCPQYSGWTCAKFTRKYLWIGEVRNVAFRLKQARIAVGDDDVILGGTMGLPGSYDTFVVALDSTT
jgi:hypothetical protein